MHRLIALFVSLLTLTVQPAFAAGSSNKEMRCEKAQRELKLVKVKLQERDPLYAGDLKRERNLWERQIEKNCYGDRRQHRR